ncbi:hypothetical protein AHF37_10623 [Paragonimus kellicotti]|nr:hypothetical protein AHF37_10623 [Paragonimus kellicotti]
MLPDLFGPENRRRCIERLGKLRGYPVYKKPISTSAVLIPLCLVQNVPSILFLQRSGHLRTHPSEIGFPGGKCDATDQDVVHTALRETYEELGIAPDSVDVWARLPRFDARSTVYPVLGFCGHLDLSSSESDLRSRGATSGGQRLHLNPDEVSNVFVRSIDWLTSPENLFYSEFRLHSTFFLLPETAGRLDSHPDAHSLQPHQVRYTLPAFGSHPLTGSVGPRIWGLTAIMAYCVLYPVFYHKVCHVQTMSAPVCCLYLVGSRCISMSIDIIAFRQ